MPASCVIGLQWGDEAKGKLVDILAPQHDIVVRYQGGANAGHTVVFGDQVYKLHHVPSGILHAGVKNVITPGVVIEPETLIRELTGLEERGNSPRSNLMISERAHMVMPWHILEDQVLNKQVVQGENIGTTLRGIGPCYRDKVGRTFAMRMSDLIKGNLQQRIDEIVAAKKNWLAGLGGGDLADQLDSETIYGLASKWSSRLGPLIGDTTNFLLDSLDDNKKLLLEGAQGSLLDIDHGTYPFVTSSNSSGVGVSAGSGVPARWIEHVIGVAKAYTTRVGGGPFPTELNDDQGAKIREIGREYGTTTGRPRRCGWFDAVAVRYTTRLSGIHGLSLMMLDVLSHFDTIKVCVAYELDGKQVTHFPAEADELRRCKPIYETVEGWKTDVTGVRRWRDLPSQLLKYVDFISELIGVPVEVVSVGPDREQTIFASSTKLSRMLRLSKAC